MIQSLSNGLTDPAIAVSLSKIVANTASGQSAKAHEGKTVVIVRHPNTKS
jgi:hypothetical protein